MCDFTTEKPTDDRLEWVACQISLLALSSRQHEADDVDEKGFDCSCHFYPSVLYTSELISKVTTLFLFLFLLRLDDRRLAGD